MPDQLNNTVPTTTSDDVPNQISQPDQQSPSLFAQLMANASSSQQPNQPVQTSPQPQPPTREQKDAALANHPAVSGAEIQHKVLRTLAGNPTRLVIDPDTGESKREPVPLSGKQLLAATLANVLGSVGQVSSNLSRRIKNQAPQPIAPLPSQQAQMQRDQMAQDDFDRIQNQKVRQAKIINANLEAMRSAYALSMEDDAAKRQAIANHADELESWNKAGAVEASNVPGDEIAKGDKWDKSRWLAIPDGLQPVFKPDGTRATNGQGVPMSATTYSLVDGTTQVPLSQDKYDQLARYSLMQTKEGFKLPEGSTISSAQLALMNHKLSLIQQTQTELDRLHDAVGSDKVDLASEIKKNPKLLSAIESFHNTSAGEDDLVKLLQSMAASSNPKVKGAVGTISALFGQQNLDKWVARNQQPPDKMSLEDAKQVLADPRTDPKSNLYTAAQGIVDASGTSEEKAYREAKEQNPELTRLQFHKQWEEKAEKPDAGTLWAGKTDIFGSSLGGPEVDRKEYNKRYDSFSKDYIQPLNRLKKTDAELTRIMNTANMTGAQKVTALLAAVGISGDPLQGKGFRINQAIVGEHAGARNIWEGAAQRANNLIGSGGPITEKQVRDYESIARDVVHDAFVAAGNEAHRQGLPVDFLPRGGGQHIDPDTAKVYLDIAGGDKDVARKAASANGWRF